ncbi:ATP-binding protein [Bacillus thuringiensis serovar brasilensis]|nr:ATP-binding protein [Bacillus thuringiensis serovar brasilensis]
MKTIVIKNGIESIREGGDIHIRVYEKMEGHLCISILGWITRS